MASLLVAGSTPGGTRTRLSFRRVERWSDPPQSEVSRAKVKKAVELLLWSEIGENDHRHTHPTTHCTFATSLEWQMQRADDFAEEWQQHGSDHIQTGYRRACGTAAGCLLSWTYIHSR